MVRCNKVLSDQHALFHLHLLHDPMLLVNFLYKNVLCADKHYSGRGEESKGSDWWIIGNKQQYRVQNTTANRCTVSSSCILIASTWVLTIVAKEEVGNNTSSQFPIADLGWRADIWQCGPQALLAEHLQSAFCLGADFWTPWPCSYQSSGRACTC
jgi:hypothetical protein